MDMNKSNDGFYHRLRLICEDILNAEPSLCTVGTIYQNIHCLGIIKEHATSPAVTLLNKSGLNKRAKFALVKSINDYDDWYRNRYQLQPSRTKKECITSSFDWLEQAFRFMGEEYIRLQLINKPEILKSIDGVIYDQTMGIRPTA